MADDERKPFLKRWSQRKLAASRAPAKPPAAVASLPEAPPPVVAQAGAAPSAVAETGAPTLPPVDSLSFESDFTPFLQPEVDEAVKRQALRKLFSDPRFNVMDGLDVYIDDYNKFEPMTPDIVAQLNHAKFLFNPPKTRVNEHGYVEDVPEEPVEAAAADDARPTDTVPPAQIVDNTTIDPLVDSAPPSGRLPAPQTPDESQ